MFIGAALAIFLTGQPDSALQQLQLFMSSSPAFEAKGTTVIDGRPPVSFTVRWQKNKDQIYTFNDTFELRQTDEALMLTDHRDKRYQEYRGFPYPVPPDAKVYFYETLAYPWFLTHASRSMKEMAGPKWTATKKGAGWTLNGEWSSDMATEVVAMELNERGLPTKVKRTITNDDGTVVIDHTITSFSGIPVFETPSLHPTPGYTPYGLVKFFTPSPGDQIRHHPLYGPDGSKTDMKSLMGRSGYVLLFTAPDCELSDRYAKDLAKLKGDLDGRGFPMVEISLGLTKPTKSFSGARLFHDSNLNLERRWAIPSTPYMICLDKDNVVIGAWEGWWSGCGADALKSLSETESAD